jgi:methylmalonyl-CoA/ethylmalonyl-CoA epimerase
MLGVPESPRFDHPSSIIYFKVNDIGSAHGLLAARGVVFEREPHLVAALPTCDLWMAFFDDGEGNTLALMCELPRGAE